MALTQLILMAVFYAIAEILPIGAAAHFTWFDAWMTHLGRVPPSMPVGMSLGLHIGLLLAASSYFWRDLGEMAQGLGRLAKGKRDPGALLVFQLIVAAIPMIAAVLAVHHFQHIPGLTPEITAWTMVGIGVLLLLFDRACMTVKRIEHAGFGDAIVLGLVQAAAIIPGVGRIAIVVAFARMLGFERRDAARFAFLISIPTLAAASAWNMYWLVRMPEAFPTNTILLGAVLGWLPGLAVIAMLMKWLRRSTFTPIALYRLVIGVNLVAFAYGWI